MTDLLRKLLHHIGMIPNATDLIVIYYDNVVALAYVKYPREHGKSMYIGTFYHYILDIIALLQVIYNIFYESHAD